MSIGTRNVLWTIVVLALLAALYFAASGIGGNSSSNATALAPSSPQSIADDRPGEPRTDEADDSLQQATLDERYERSNDLHALTLELSSSSDQGNGQASRLIARAYEECWLYAINPAGFEQDMQMRAQQQPDWSKSIEAVARRIVKRCHGFAHADIARVGPNAIRAMLKKAASQGELAAEVQLLVSTPTWERASFDPAHQKKLAERVLLSRNAEAYAAMAMIMGPASNGLQQDLAPLPAGSYLAEAAWQLAACRLGRDCSSGSSTVAIMCFGGGVNCALHSLEQFYLQEMLPPADREKLWQQVDMLTKRRGTL